MAPPALERLDQIEAPTHILLGRYDLETTKDATERLCAGIRHAQRTDWPDSAHLPSLEHPDRFTELLRGWLADQNKPNRSARPFPKDGRLTTRPREAQ